MLKTNEVNEINAEKVSHYFQELSNYDEMIARQDIAYVQTKLKHFRKRAGPLSEEVNTEIKKIIGWAMGGHGAAIVFDLVHLLNPLNLLSPVEELYEFSLGIAKSARAEVNDGFLIYELSNLVSDTETLNLEFKENQKQFQSKHEKNHRTDRKFRSY